MNISCGIIGLPNVGKSTLFNALLKKQAALAANYPFATIEPNVGIVPVPDERLSKLAEITAQEIAGHNESNPSTSLRVSLPPIVSATVQFVDIAGLVKGAAEGAGLGNKFLSHIREVSVIAHVVRAFVDENVVREGSSDPESDYVTITTELILADLQTVQNQEVRSKNKELSPIINKLKENLNLGIPVRNMKFTPEEKEYVDTLFLLTAKQELIVLNVSEDEYTLINIAPLTEKYANIFQLPKDRFVVICAKIESDLAGLTEDEQKQYLLDLGFPNSGLERLIQKAYENLGLISFLTAGEKEVRAWTIKNGSTAVIASGEIHTDFVKKFIKAEVVSYEDFVANNGWKGSREKGKARLEGKDYIMRDGDVVEFKIGS